jgi:hypothetical protein
VTAARLFARRSTSSDISPGGARLDVTKPDLAAATVHDSDRHRPFQAALP